MAQNPAISLPQQSGIVAGQQAQGVAVTIDPMAFQETPLAFRPGACGCFSRVLVFVACAVLVVGVVYVVQCLFATAGGF